MPWLFCPWERPSTNCAGGWLGPRSILERQGKSHFTRIQPQTVQPIGSHCTDYGIWAHIPLQYLWDIFKIMFSCVLIVLWIVEQNVKSQNSKQCVWKLSVHLLILVFFSFKTLAILCLLTKNSWRKFEPVSLTIPQWMYADMCLTYIWQSVSSCFIVLYVACLCFLNVLFASCSCYFVMTVCGMFHYFIYLFPHE